MCAAVVVRAGCTLTTAALRMWAKGRMAGYKVPSRVATVDALPLNVMGKVLKPALQRTFEEG